jgi:sporulation protein YlmC with PRC-barrel domain
MKTLTSSLMVLALVTAIPAAGFAQSGDRTGTDRATDRRANERGTAERAKKDRPAWNNTQNLHETGDIIGASVQNAEGKNIGKVDALLLDPKDGKVSHAVVGLGGILGIGDEKVVVPYTALKMRGHEGGRKGTISMDQSALDSAPNYVKASDRQPSASPATSPPGTTSGAGGFSGDPRATGARDADGRPIGDKPPADSHPAVKSDTPRSSDKSSDKK